MPHYKVFRRFNGVLCSICVASAAFTFYPEKQWTTGKKWLTNQGYLPLFFETIEDARAFLQIGGFEHDELWEVETRCVLAENPKPIGADQLYRIQDIRKSAEMRLFEGIWPKGSKMGHVKPVRLVEVYHRED
jgi:hypothetical protein